METVKIKLHSSVDLITNSSTVIFTYSGGSLQAVKDLVNEMLKVFGRSEKFDDIFYAGIFLESNYHYEDFLERDQDDDDEESENLENIDIEQIIEDVLVGKIEKPTWMESAEEDEDERGYTPSTALYIRAKDEQYTELANQLLNFLYSTSNEASYG